MLRDIKFLSRDSGKNTNSDEVENLPLNSRDYLVPQISTDPTRPPLNAIQDSFRIPRCISDQEISSSRVNRPDRTPTKPKPKYSDTQMPLRTPEKQGPMSKRRYSWSQKHECPSTNSVLDTKEDVKIVSNMNTPSSARVVGGINSNNSECTSTHSTPTKSGNKPPTPGFCVASGSRTLLNTGSRMANYAPSAKGTSNPCNLSNTVNSGVVPYFELKEDSSFWMEHNVQVLIRIRPLNNMEKNSFGFSRCLKQESSQSVTWIGTPETRFMFDHVACETIDQATLFRMVGLPMVENCLSGYNSCMFAYGQTGSGKTYTMLGEIEGVDVKPSPNRGMTPRIFELLFARIKAEEESRKDERLNYNCKCSFLEIYNEQITDLLDPSSTNLMLREDIKNGVYVENLSEFEVHTVGDILQLLTQGSSNRRVAATNMNRESSRSHSVFTCVIESTWEKDSTTNFRYARLNLVDLAGSERQKSSGAEGERLKEAASINKSLSTLGHVIMLLVDVAHGKPRHVPYRDSRLTFLLQDSLGGNSKTMIIANVSPSICSAAETMNTLKFAQRAKLIQNNAIINEDSSGDVISLKNQIQLLKEELSALKHEKILRPLSYEVDTGNNYNEKAITKENSLNMPCNEHGVLRVSCKQLKSLETTLTGSLRREQMADISIKQLEAEIEQLNRLVSHREEDTRCTKMMLKFREDKIQRLESLLGGLMPADDYLLKENHALSEEIELLRARIDKNPEVTRFALENIRLLEKVRQFQELYDEGEREILMSEISELRNQIIFSHGGNSKHPNKFDIKVSNHGEDQNDSLHKELKNTLFELEETKMKLKFCLEENANIRSEIQELHESLNEKTPAVHEHDCSTEVIKESIVEIPMLSNQQMTAFQRGTERPKCGNIMNQAEAIIGLQLELDILKIVLQEERSQRTETEELFKTVNEALQFSNGKVLSVMKEYEEVQEALTNVKLVVEALESQQIELINEIEDLKNSNDHYQEFVKEKELEISRLKVQAHGEGFRNISRCKPSERADSLLEAKMKKMHASLERAKRLNNCYESDLAFQESHEEEMEEARKQVEGETAQVIVCLQEELSWLQEEVETSKRKEMDSRERLEVLQTQMGILEGHLYSRSEENKNLAGMLEEREEQLRVLKEEYTLIASEIEDILYGGNEALKDVGEEIDAISCLIPPKQTWISQKFGSIKECILEKELLIEELNKCLKDAVDRKDEMDFMLRSLRGAVAVMSEPHQQVCSEKDKEILLLSYDINDKKTTVKELLSSRMHCEDQLKMASSCATAALVIVNRLWELNSSYQDALNNKDRQLRDFQEIIAQKDTMLSNQVTKIDEANEYCRKVSLQLREEQITKEALLVTLGVNEDHDILEIGEKMKELNSGVSSLISCMDKHAKKSATYLDDNSESSICFSANDECRSSTGPSIEQTIQNVAACPNGNGRYAAILSLKQEAECAVKGLQDMLVEMGKLVAKHEETSVTEKSNQKSIRSLINQVFLLQNALDNFEHELELRVNTMDAKIGKMEKAVQGSFTSLFQQQELLEAELDDAKALATQKIIEASCILEKFDEVQDTMKEADIMINELMIANEALKLSVHDLKAKESYFISERSVLLDEVQSLKCSNKLKDENYQILENKHDTDFAIIKTMLLELEDDISELQTTAIKDWTSAASNFLSVKSQLHESADSLRSLLEEVWSEIILKDSAVSVLHLCHMGILLETANGLTAENGLLRHGLFESNSLITELREHNFRSRRELEMCSVTKGKLLADIKKSFDRISSKVGEAGDVTLKLNCFEKKIQDLQFQEEKMLQRHNNMGSELSGLMKELELSNKEMIASILDQEGSLKEKDVKLQCQETYIMVEVFAKDILLLILSSELDQMSLHKADVEKSGIISLALLEKLKKDLVLKSIDAAFTESILFDKESNNENLLKELKMKESSLHASSGHIARLCQQILILQNDISLQTNESSRLQFDLGKKDEEIRKISWLENHKISCLEMENKTLQCQLSNSKAEYDILSMDLENRKMEFGVENHKLRDEISTLGHCIATLDADLNLARLQVEEHKLSHSVFKDCMRLTIQDLERELGNACSLEEENILLKNEVRSCEINKSENLRDLNCRVLKTVDLTKNMEELCFKLLNLTAGNSVKVEDMLQEVVKEMKSVNTFMGQFECLEDQAGQLDSKILSLQMDLSRREDILRGALFDLSLLQESASSCQDQKHEMEELLSSLCSMEKEFDLKSLELDQAVSDGQIREARLQEMAAKISALELDHTNHQEMLSSLSNKNAELLAGAKDAFDENNSLQNKLMEARVKVENLEMEVAEMEMTMAQMSKTTESLKSELDSVTCQRDELDGKFHILTKELEMARGLVEHNEAIAVEAQAIAEFQKVHFKEKEEEVKLLERSIEELECTINVLEQKVDIVKGEAERQHLQREELELELLGVKEHMQSIKSSDCDIKRCLDEKEKSLQDALWRVQLLEKEIAGRDNEISKCKAHISELNLHAEAQADEYKQKFKALEIMVEQVKSDCPATHSTNSSSNKLEKSTSKSKGSGSPFKCIGLGLMQQMKSERDEEVSAGRQRIEELEALAASRQKEVFMLKARLATTESMTHDVIRDLLGVKLNMKNYADLMDNQQLHSLTEEAKHHKVEAELKEQEVANLKQQINEFITERNGWLEEIQRKQSELVAAHVALEKLRRQEQLLSAENDILKIENSDHKTRVKEVETEVQKLSGQLNIQQRIHHHAKIKEENNLLRFHNEELSLKLRKTEVILSRVKEELAQFRAANGKTPYINFDEEQLLHKKLKETEDERVQLAQKLLGLCTRVLKAAGIKRATSEVTPSIAEEALGQLENRVLSLEMELQDAKLKNRISDERVRLSELRPQTSAAARSRTNENCLGRKRTSQTTFLSTIDR